MKSNSTRRGVVSPEEAPAYSIARASHVIRVSPSTLRVWACGDGHDKALFSLASARKAPPTLSFSNLVESFVLASMRRVHGVSMQRVRRALKYVARELSVERPLIHAQFKSDGVDLFMEQAGQLLVVSRQGQTALREVLDAHLNRIDWGKDVAERLYPWVHADGSTTQPKSIVVDPRRGFGQPVITGTGIEARIVAERYRAGESAADLADDYQLEVAQIDDAIRCETREAA